VTPVAARLHELVDDVFQTDPSLPAAETSPLSVHLGSTHNSSLQQQEDGDQQGDLPSTRSSSLQQGPDSSLETDMFEATPQKPYVNRSRGNPKFSGPAASLFQAFGHQATLACPPGQRTSGSDESAAEELDNRKHGAEADETGVEELGITVMVRCICGDGRVTESQASAFV
jgi:hypothetical protein